MKHHDDDGGESCPVSAVVSQGNYEVTNGQLEKRNIIMIMGVRAVLSLQWCLRGTISYKWPPENKNRNIMMMMLGVRAALSLSAVVSQRNYEVTNGQLEKKTETS